jgi:hypothetical protein
VGTLELESKTLLIVKMSSCSVRSTWNSTVFEEPFCVRTSPRRKHGEGLVTKLMYALL